MKIINQNFEGSKNGLFVEREREREREKESSYLPVFKTDQGFDLSVFSARGGSAFGRQFNIQRGKSDAIFAADFLFFNMNLEKLK